MKWSEKPFRNKKNHALPSNMFKLPALPSPGANTNELADFAELLAWQNDSISMREIIAYLGRLSENDFNEGVDDEDDRSADALDDVMTEIDRRSKSCLSGYPFYLDMEGTVIRHKNDDKSPQADIYRYLLLSTRLNMAKDKVQDGIDGTSILEEVAAVILRCYLGEKRAKSFVFGTANSGRFEDKINELCREIGEGGRFCHVDPSPVKANDDKLDAVAWVPFTDGRPGKIVIFCQCKTGSNWQDQITQLQPEAFLKRWTSHRTYVLNPIRAFCISECPDTTRWEGIASYAGLLFDRLRIVDFLYEISEDLITKVRCWNTGASATAKRAIT